MSTDKLMELVLGAVILAVIAAIVKTVQEVQALKQEMAVLRAESEIYKQKYGELGDQMREIAENLVEFGREMSATAATLKFVADMLQQKTPFHRE